MLNFPNSPTLNQYYSYGVRTWQWNGSAWNIVQGAIDATTLSGYPASYFLNAANITGNPNPPSGLSLLEDNGVVTVSFSGYTGYSSYEVWSAIGTPSGYGLISIINPSEITPSMSVDDSSYTIKTGIYYKVYSTLNGYRSSGLTGWINVTGEVTDVSNLEVIPTFNSYIIQYELPEDRRLAGVQIYMDRKTTQGALSLGTATVVYAGDSNKYIYNVEDPYHFHYHQFWVYSVTR